MSLIVVVSPCPKPMPKAKPAFGAPRRRALAALGLLLLVILLGACGLTSVRMREMVDEGDHADAIRVGEKWLRSSAAGRDPGPERVAIQRLVAEATLREVQRAPSIGGFQKFRALFGDRTLYGALIDESLAHESGLVFRQQVLPARSVEAHQRFRTTYPNAPDGSASRSREAHLAAEEARALGTIDALRAMRATYSDWPEAQAVLIAVYEDEAQLALTAAAATKDPRALQEHREIYTEPHWREASFALEVEVALDGATAAIGADQALSPAAIEALLRQYGEGARRAPTASLRKAELWDLAQRTQLSDAYYVRRLLFPDGQSRAALARERDLGWEEALQRGTAERYLTFVDRYPEDPRALEAEERHTRLARVAAAGATWPRATVQRQRVLPSGEIELLVDVRDCHGRRVSGLTRELFELYAGGAPLPLTGFHGLEDERPLDLVFALDLSGSMAVEREAVRYALTQFAETFRYRGRDTRLGLVTFADKIGVRSALTNDPATFQRWIAKLPENTGGGFGEDTAGALAKIASMGLRPNAERVVVLLSDENLQINKAGRSALRMKISPECSRLIAAVECSARCRGAKCLLGCIKGVSDEASRELKQCARRYSARACLSYYPWDSLLGAATQCVEGGSDAARALAPLGELLLKREIRPYFLVPSVDPGTGAPIAGYASVAQHVGGSVLWVPADSASPKPYVEALMDIADQLSKQYTIRVQPGAEGGARSVLVRPGRIWNELAGLTLPSLVGLYPQTTHKPGCTDFVGFSGDGQVLTSASCGRTWTGASLGLGPLAGSIATGESIVVQVDTTGAAVELPLDNPGAGGVAVIEGRVFAMSSTPDGTLLLAADQSGQAQVVVRARDGEPRVIGALTQRPAPGGGAIYGWQRAGTAAVCYMPTTAAVACTDDDGATWTSEAPQGLPPWALDGRTVAHSVTGRPGTVLLPLGDGAVYRTIDGGRVWTQVLGPAGGRRQLVSLAGRRSALCAAGPDGVDCSEDWGRSWYAVGGAWDSGFSGASVVADGATLYLAQQGGVARLDRVVSRDLPSSSVYFATAVDAPYPSLEPFLAEVASTLRSDPLTTLRVEGHADLRGTDEANEDLARRRADNVASIVASHGVDRARIQVVSFGERRPVRQGTTPADLAKNRRVEILVLRRSPPSGWDMTDCDEQTSPDVQRLHEESETDDDYDEWDE